MGKKWKSEVHKLQQVVPVMFPGSTRIPTPETIHLSMLYLYLGKKREISPQKAGI